ncbi:MAG: alanine racemase [Anaerolineaceae bacterium]|nr:alanine racemase [Anaerolineaceae bacterium]
MDIFDQIEKPTLLLDEATARANLSRMVAKLRALGVRFRPHFKTHQSISIGEWFRQAGVEHITVSSLDMARYFAGAGWQDISLAFPANLRQAGALGELARQVRLHLLVESPETVHFLGQRLEAPVELWIKIDVGNHRTGVGVDDPAAVAAVCRAAASFPHLHLRGLLTHAGQTYRAHSPEEICRVYQASVEALNRLRRQLATDGIGPLEISVGDTPACSACADLGAVDEARPGNFIFYDAQQLQTGACTAADIAVALACPVVARHPERGEVVVYGGAIHLSKDYWVEDGEKKYGLVALPAGKRWGELLPGAYVSGLSQEHGILRLPAEALARVAVGDLLCLLPAHSGLSVQVMGSYLTLDGQAISTLNWPGRDAAA